MKNLIFLLLTLFCVLALISCSETKENDSKPQTTESEVNSNITTETDNISNNTENSSFLTCYTSLKPIWSSPDLQMSQEQAEFIMGVWNNSVWENDITKTEYDYVFCGDNIEVRYCYDEGIFNDVINDKHVILSDDIREQVNKTVDKFIVVPIIN